MSVIECRGVSKRFRLPLAREHKPTLKGRLFDRILGRGERDELVCLRDVSFSLAGGRTYGLVGKNGSGKSTLLRLLAGIYRPDSGSVRVAARTASLLGLGVGFHPELTGAENIYVNAALLGFSRGDIRGRIEDMVRFADLGEFMRQPVRVYSSGMRMRLGFAVAAHVDCDVFLIDEALAVGDMLFQEKCRAKLCELENAGKTVLVASHDAAALERSCSELLWLEGGRLRAQGPVREILEAYRAHA